MKLSRLANRSKSARESTFIPLELYPFILQHLPKSDLANCLRVSKDFHLAVIPILYRDITIYTGKECNPGLIKRKPTSPPFSFSTTVKKIKEGHKGYTTGWLGPTVDQWRQREKDEREKEDEEMLRGTGYIEGEKSKWLSKILGFPVQYSSYRLRRLHLTPPSFEYTTHLTLVSHHWGCWEYRSLILPHLITLSLPSDINGSPPRWCCHSTIEHSDECNESSNCVCLLISKLKPRRLVLGNKDTHPSACVENRRITVWPPLPTCSWEWLREVVIHATSYGMVHVGRGHVTNIARMSGIEVLPPLKLDKLTFILYRKEYEGWVETTEWRRSGPMIRKVEWRLDLLWRKLVLALKGDPGIMEIVGMEEMDEKLSNEDFAYWDKELMEVEMKKYLIQDVGLDDQQAERRVHNVKYTRKDEYEFKW